jgi:two-component system response regulator DesR
VRRKKRVLLVDDVAPLRTFVAMFIDRSDDFEVVGQAGNAQEALDEVTRSEPDVIILDVNMPGRTGIDILPELRRTLPKAVIIVFSGFESVAISEKAKRLGADAYVEKGTPAARLLDIMRELTVDMELD